MPTGWRRSPAGWWRIASPPAADHPRGPVPAKQQPRVVLGARRRRSPRHTMVRGRRARPRRRPGAARAGGAFDHPGCGGDPLPQPDTVAQFRGPVEGLHDLVVGDPRRPTRPVELRPVLLKPDGGTIAANIVEDLPPPMASTAGVRAWGRPAQQGALSHLGEDRQLHLHVGLDDRRQSVLSIHQHPVQSKATPGGSPSLPPAASPRRRAHRRRGHRSLRRVRRQQLRRPPRGGHLHPAPHANHPLLSRLPIGHLPRPP